MILYLIGNQCNCCSAGVTWKRGHRSYYRHWKYLSNLWKITPDILSVQYGQTRISFNGHFATDTVLYASCSFTPRCDWCYLCVTSCSRWCHLNLKMSPDTDIYRRDLAPLTPTPTSAHNRPTLQKWSPSRSSLTHRAALIVSCSPQQDTSQAANTKDTDPRSLHSPAFAGIRWLTWERWHAAGEISVTSRSYASHRTTRPIVWHLYFWINVKIEKYNIINKNATVNLLW